jgi:predicted nucleic acid-binding protein
VAEGAPLAYFDTSAVVKRYVAEPGSDAVRRLLRNHRVVSSVLLRLESVSAVRRRHAEGQLTDTQQRRLLRRIEADDASWELVPIGDDVVEGARRLLLAHPLRTLDAILLASASLVAAEGVPMPFVTADHRQADAGRLAGLEVVEIATA